MFQVMLIINTASASGGAYWARSAVHTCWLGQGAVLLGLTGAVGQADLRSVMLGRDPSGEPLTSRPGLRRRHGWDLVLAAPKSVSLLAEAGSGPASSGLREPYRQAVSDVVVALEQRAAWMRSGGAQVPAEGVVAAAFEHVANDSGHPHLHTHLVLANLAAGANGYWGCLVGNELWRWREGLGAAFHLALRSRITEAGFGFRWELSEGGYGEIVTVPSNARRVASSRSLTLRATAHSFGSVSPAARRAAQATTRTGRRSAGTGLAGPGLAGAGWGDVEAGQVLRDALRSPALPSAPPAPAAVAHALAQRGSAFGEADVFVALAETLPSGLDLHQASEWVRKWCRASPSLGTGIHARARPATTPERWTTSLASQLDRRVVDLETEARFAHLAQVSPVIAERELADLGTAPAVAQVAVRLACAGAGIDVLPRAPWLAQAACIDAARAAWQAAGVMVAVACPSELSARRWRALTSLRSPTPGSYAAGYQSSSSRQKRVLVVDAADHLSPSTLAGLLRQASATRTKIVLVPGGTVPGNGPSLARSLDYLLEQLSAASPSLADAEAPQLLERPAHPAVSVPGIAVQGSLTGTDAMGHVVAAWAGVVRSGAFPPLMVAFGPAEAEALNRAARAVQRELRAQGAPPLASGGTSETVLGERRYAVGEQVLALRRLGNVRSATTGTVVALRPRSVSVEWHVSAGAWRSEVGTDHAPSLGYGYATTVPYLRSCEEAGRDLLVLGDPLELAARSVRARSAWVAVPGPACPWWAWRPFRPGTERRWPNWPPVGRTAKCWTGRARAHWTTSGAGAGPNTLHPAPWAATWGSATSATPPPSA